jgi:hypothetical protein
MASLDSNKRNIQGPQQQQSTVSEVPQQEDVLQNAVSQSTSTKTYYHNKK